MNDPKHGCSTGSSTVGLPIGKPGSPFNVFRLLFFLQQAVVIRLSRLGIRIRELG